MSANGTYIVHQALHIDQNFVAGGQAFYLAFLTPHTDGMYGDRRIRIFLLDHIESLFDTAQHFCTSLFVLESDGKTESRLSRRAITFRKYDNFFSWEMRGGKGGETRE